MGTEHMKYYNSQGNEVPSVTTVIKLYNKQLEPWANWIGKKGIDYKTFLQEKASLGTYIHSVCEKFFSNDKDIDLHPDTNFVSVSDYKILLGRFQYVYDLMLNNGYRPYAQEMSIHGEEYGGTIDLLFYNEDENKYLMIDLKTAKNVYDTMYMQLIAYCKLLEEKHNIHVDEVAILLVMRDCEDKDFLTFYNTNDIYLQRLYKIFACLLNIYYLLDEKERKKLIS